MRKLKPPCEIVVWYLIPGIRSVLAKKLFNLGMKQKEISNILNITQPAVSQYLSDKRGNEVGFSDEILAMIKNLAHDLKDSELEKIDIIPRICEICRKTKAEDILCMTHKEKDIVPEGCKACLGSEAGGCNESSPKKGTVVEECNLCSDPSEHVLFYDI
ncbi:hypothetical protein ALNOE001_18400 [Candidatus Methanobinarius endosymbioticus]|uniref:HTH cro/C1-type domain-containing protein n=1 Tax=Candidatus Methanobinarius endosymbioticus TaxID=2006182 RepID=A0A366M9U0_9EURY|nr:hypothetical protein ALNOE001_18400 [Candidatus Methanobinarius endosymbioticus]